MSARALTLYDSDSDSDASSLAGDRRPMASMSIANDPCRRDNDSDRFSLDSDLETTYSDTDEEYITSEQAQKYNPAGLRVEARRTLDYDSDSDDDGNANRGYSAQDTGGFNRRVMANGMDDDTDDDSDLDPMISGRRDLPRAFVSNDAELDALLPVGHARDKVITTSTINAETGRVEEIKQFREGEQERPNRRVRIVSSSTKSAEIVSQALAKARADKTQIKKALGGEGQAELTEKEKKTITARTKIMRGVEEVAKRGGLNESGGLKKQEIFKEALTELPAKRQAQIRAKADQIAKKDELMGEVKQAVLTKKIEGMAKKLNKVVVGRAFQKLTANAKAERVLEEAKTLAMKQSSQKRLLQVWRASVGKIREEQAIKEDAELNEAITKQQRQTLANLLTAKGFAPEEAEEVAKGGEFDDRSTLAGTEAGTDPRTAKSTAITTAREEIERIQAEVEPIMIGDKELKVERTIGGRNQIKFGGQTITSNLANLPVLEKIQAELGKTRRTDPLANAIREIIDKRIAQAKSTRGGGVAGGQGKRKSGAVAVAVASGGGASAGGGGAGGKKA